MAARQNSIPLTIKFTIICKSLDRIDHLVLLFMYFVVQSNPRFAQFMQQVGRNMMIGDERRRFECKSFSVRREQSCAAQAPTYSKRKVHCRQYAYLCVFSVLRSVLFFFYCLFNMSVLICVCMFYTAHCIPKWCLILIIIIIIVMDV